MSLDDVLAALRAKARPEKVAIFHAYHKVDRPYLGVSVPDITSVARSIVASSSAEEALALADALWRTNIFEARVLAAKILCEKRLKGFSAIWALIRNWLDDLDSWAIADTVANAGSRCLLDDPSLLDEVEGWTRAESFWTRRAALVFTLDWAKRGRDPERMLAWASSYVGDKEWFIGKAIGWWLRELSKHNPDRVRRFLAEHEGRLASVTRREATKYLK
ncbi:MAG: DNA alkylation repair protein [Hyphomicrobiales bacterium]|nr:MAG: DNA alkylation repair protein [Hyphomicrobiales bacterium]